MLRGREGHSFDFAFLPTAHSPKAGSVSLKTTTLSSRFQQERPDGSGVMNVLDSDLTIAQTTLSNLFVTLLCTGRFGYSSATGRE